jgi:hypothetical protein
MHICKKWAPLISKATPINQCVKISVQICFTNCEDTWVKMGWKVHLCWQLLCKHYMNLNYKFSSVQIKQVQKYIPHHNWYVMVYIHMNLVTLNNTRTSFCVSIIFKLSINPLIS